MSQSLELSDLLRRQGPPSATRRSWSPGLAVSILPQCLIFSWTCGFIRSFVRWVLCIVTEPGVVLGGPSLSVGSPSQSTVSLAEPPPSLVVQKRVKKEGNDNENAPKDP